MSIRLAQESDLAGMLVLMQALNPDDPALEADLARSRWLQLLEYPGAFVFVQEQNDRLIASCTLLVMPNLTRGARSYALIENVVTLSAFRGQGHGRAVLDAALAKAWQMDCYKVMLSTSARTPGVLEFYRRCGFRDGVKTGFVAVPG